MKIMGFSIGTKISDITIMKSLHLLISANISIQEALRRISEKLPDNEMSERLSMASEMVSKEGRTLPEAMREVGLFAKYVDLIEIGQQTGNLNTLLKELIDMEEEIAAAKKKIISAMIYPLVVTCVSIAVGYGLTFVLGNILKALKLPGIENEFSYKMGKFIVSYRTIIFLSYTSLAGSVIAFTFKNADKMPVIRNVHSSLILGQAFKVVSLALMSGLSPATAFRRVADFSQGIWANIFQMVADESVSRNLSDVIDEIEEYLPFESYLLLKVKIDTANMSEGFAMIGTRMIHDAIAKFSIIGTFVNVFAFFFVALQVIVIMSPVYTMIFTFVDKSMAGKMF
ncbi:MAG: type II secretion system F family protein [Syntrophorhabdaceae bacterium]